MENSDKTPVYPVIPNTTTQQTTVNDTLPTYNQATSYPQTNINNLQPINNGYPQGGYIGNPRIVTVTQPNTCVVGTHCHEACREERRIRRRRKAIISFTTFILCLIIFCIIFFSTRST
ncbi:Hypothetical protein SRAE_1000301900 [Strongyloides ratti]|uniref:Uncharacterized protein n=1 Tax=Strongyloides ratti TaxID=34506 RepID=A0A090L4Q3_STRRB|nr:Hypothetical protein SRAE_1000301900 [Strongyloides ratti]CEF64766.1 Hypothetical protein SRAE_1000301900 [Strongyloides ratti]